MSNERIPMFATRNDHVTTAHWRILGFARWGNFRINDFLFMLLPDTILYTQDGSIPLCLD